MTAQNLASEARADTKDDSYSGLLDDLKKATKASISGYKAKRRKLLKQRFEEWLEREERLASEMVEHLPDILLDVAETAETPSDARYKVGLDLQRLTSAENYRVRANGNWDFPRGRTLETLRGAAAIIRDWAEERGLTVEIDENYDGMTSCPRMVISWDLE